MVYSDEGARALFIMYLYVFICFILVSTKAFRNAEKFLFSFQHFIFLQNRLCLCENDTAKNLTVYLSKRSDFVLNELNSSLPNKGNDGEIEIDFRYLSGVMLCFKICFRVTRNNSVRKT